MASSRTWVGVLLVGWVLFAATAPARAQGVCAGDCGGDGPVTVDELLTMVNIALDAAPLTGCVAGERRP
jgi:hypothetical protein